MLKDFVWKAFESTGNIDAYVFYKEIEEKNNVLVAPKLNEDEVTVKS